jgi:hypothetical protein
MIGVVGVNWIRVSELKKPTKLRILYVDSLQYKGPGIYLQVEPCAIVNHRNYLLREW